MIKSLALNKWVFWWGLVAYCGLSFILFLYTHSGWSGLAIFMTLGAIYPIILGVTLIINIITSFIKKPIRPQISWTLLLFLLITQIIALFTSVSDCGDGSGSYRFYETLLKTNGWEYCNMGKEAASLSFIIDIINPLFVIIILLIFLIQAYYRGRGDFYKNLGTRKNFFIKIKALIAVSLISCILSIPLISIELIFRDGLENFSFFYYFYLPFIILPVLLLVPINNTTPNLISYLLKIKWLFLYPVLYYIYFFWWIISCNFSFRC